MYVDVFSRSLGQEYKDITAPETHENTACIADTTLKETKNYINITRKRVKYLKHLKINQQTMYIL